jgi:hypothetical protein
MFEVPLDQATARAIRIAVEGGLTRIAYLRVSEGGAVWEASSGQILMVLEAKGIEAPIGVYSLDMDRVKRIAEMPRSIRTAADDRLRIDGPAATPLDTMSVWPPAQAPGCKMSVIFPHSFAQIHRILKVLGHNVTHGVGVTVYARPMPWVISSMDTRRKVTFLVSGGRPDLDARGGYAPCGDRWEWK